jgi:hypothetical protein
MSYTIGRFPSGAVIQGLIYLILPGGGGLTIGSKPIASENLDDIRDRYGQLGA